MKEEGFRTFLTKSTRSLSSINFRIQIVKQFEYTLQTFFGVDNADLATEEDLISFGEWLEKEGVIEKFAKSYCRFVNQYFIFIDKLDLAKIAQNRFRKIEKKEV